MIDSRTMMLPIFELQYDDGIMIVSCIMLNFMRHIFTFLLTPTRDPSMVHLWNGLPASVVSTLEDFKRLVGAGNL